MPVPPKRRKRISMFPDQLEMSAGQSTLSTPLLVVVALYDCDPDHKDELGFREGDRIVVTKKLNKDWWVSPWHYCCLIWGRKKLISYPIPVLEVQPVGLGMRPVFNQLLNTCSFIQRDVYIHTMCTAYLCTSLQRGYVENNPERIGVFPINYVEEPPESVSWEECVAFRTFCRF